MLSVRADFSDVLSGFVCCAACLFNMLDWAVLSARYYARFICIGEHKIQKSAQIIFCKFAQILVVLQYYCFAPSQCRCRKWVVP